MNHFVLNRSEYTRDLDIIGAYITDTAEYLSRMSKAPLEECLEYVKKNIKQGGQFPLQDPEVFYLAKETPGNREAYTGTFSSYLGNVVTNGHLLSPTMAVYVSPKKQKSLIAMYIGGNLKKRKGFKKAMFVAEMEGDKPREGYYNNLQNSCKIKNNSVSGAHASPYTVLYNKSSHSTLTSTCRSAASYGNANNEKFIMGNRHYYEPKIVVGNILATVRKTDFKALTEALQQFKIRCPTVDETMECIEYSTKNYWRHQGEMEKIRNLVETLSPVERAAFVYIGDFYHLAKYNPNVVRQFLDDMTETVDIEHPNPKEVMKALSSDMISLVSLLRADIMGGRLMSKVEEEDLKGYAVLASNAERINKVLDNYQVLIRGLLRPNILPTSIAALPTILRRCVVVSDTDSTIFTTQHWVEWYNGRIDFSKKSLAVGYVMTYMASQMVIHLLAMMSANIGVVEEQIHQLTMKNEYCFPIFSLTSRAKHYFARISAQEGNVFKKMKTEIKGVELRSSNAPPDVNKRLEQYMIAISEGIMSRGKLKLHDVLGPVAEIEQEIINDIKSGGFRFMKTTQIRDHSSYVAGQDAPPYMHYRMWQDVFAEKYGAAPAPPYTAVRISIDLGTRSRTANWLASMKDREIAQKLEKWLKDNTKDKIEVMMLPQQNLALMGMPEEVISAINLRKLIYGIMAPFYLVLESLGIYMVNDDFSRLVSDTYGISHTDGASQAEIAVSPEQATAAMEMIQELSTNEEDGGNDTPEDLIIYSTDTTNNLD